MVAVKDFIGTGMYTVREAALYARVQTGLMTRWLFGSKSGKSVINPQYGNREKIVSFLDLVQTLAIREIRLQNKIPLPKFRQAIKYAREHFGFEYPFARKHTTYLAPYGELVINFPGIKGGLVEVSGRRKGQRLFPFIEKYLDDLTFNPDGLARCYRIFSNPKNNVTVEMDPERRFGEPLLPSGYTAIAIFDAIKAERDMESVSRIYDIPEDEVETAYLFYSKYLDKSGP